MKVRVLARTTKAAEMVDTNIGDLVVIQRKTAAPNEWPLARVEKVYYGNDARVRVADLATQNGSFTRPIHKLIRLPMN